MLVVLEHCSSYRDNIFQFLREVQHDTKCREHATTAAGTDRSTSDMILDRTMQRTRSLQSQ